MAKKAKVVKKPSAKSNKKPVKGGKETVSASVKKAMREYGVSD